MKKIILLIFCLLLAFYVGWPLWSATRIHAALEANDARTLEAKVDFPAVRASLRPVVASEVDRALDKATGRGLGQLLGGAVKQQLGPQLVETILNGFVTPKSLGELYLRRRDIREILAERAGRRAEAGRAGEPPPAEPASGGDDKAPDAGSDAAAKGRATSAGGTPRGKLGIGNVKRLAFTGPLAFEVGIARDPAATQPDITAQLGFRGFDWKLVGLIPKPRS